jgi:hypothetical protein
MTNPTGEDRFAELVKYYAKMDQSPDTIWPMESTTSVAPEDTFDVLADDPAARPPYEAIKRAVDRLNAKASLPGLLEGETPSQAQDTGADALSDQHDAAVKRLQADVRAKFDREEAMSDTTDRIVMTEVAHAYANAEPIDPGSPEYAAARARLEPALAAERAQLAREDATDDVLIDVSHERLAQHEKWGQQDHPDALSNYPLVRYNNHKHMTAAELAARAKEIFEHDVLAGERDWQDILLEEVFESLEAAQRARHPEDLRAELIQVAAVAVAWVEAIDRRGAE